MPLQRLRGASSISILDPERCTVEAYQVFRESQFFGKLGQVRRIAKRYRFPVFFWCALSGAEGCKRGVRGLLP